MRLETMKLTITSLRGTDFDGEASAFTVKTRSGEITILDHHRPLITVLAPGKAVITAPDGTKKELAVSGGFLEMDAENHAKVLLD